MVAVSLFGKQKKEKGRASFLKKRSKKLLLDWATGAETDTGSGPEDAPSS
jgi:hypothetical protein